MLTMLLNDNPSNSSRFIPLLTKVRTAFPSPRAIIVLYDSLCVINFRTPFSLLYNFTSMRESAPADSQNNKSVTNSQMRDERREGLGLDFLLKLGALDMRWQKSLAADGEALVIACTDFRVGVHKIVLIQ